MAIIANLDINLRALTKSFDKNIRKSTGFIGGFGATVKKLAGVGAGVAAGFGAVGGVAGVVASKVFSLNQELKDFERFGLTAGDSFGQFSVLADKAGLEVEELVDLTKDLGVRIGEAVKDGTGEIPEIFKRLNLNVQSLQFQKPEQQLRAFAEAISKVENETERLALTDILLSDAGTKALGILSQGAGAFDDAATQAERFGLALSQTDITQLEMARQSMANIGIVASGVWQQITIQAAPVLTAVANMFMDGAAAAGGFGVVVEQGMSILVAGIGFAMDGWNVLMGAWKAGQGIVTLTIGGALSALADLESLLIRMGGQSFDFGIKDLADSMIDEASSLLKTSGEKFGQGFSGSASRDMERRIADIKASATSAAKDIEAKKVAAPPKIEPPQIDIAAVGTRFAAAFQTGFANMDVEAIFGKPEAEKDKPSVSALARGSSAAQSALNSLKKDGNKDGVEKEIKKSHEEEQKELETQTDQLKQIKTAITEAAGVVVGIF